MRKSQSIAVEQKLQLWAEESNENAKDANAEEEVMVFFFHTHTQTKKIGEYQKLLNFRPRIKSESIFWGALINFRLKLFSHPSLSGVKLSKF